MQSNEIRSHLTKPMKNHSKWIKDLNMRLDTVKLLGENVEQKLVNIGLGNDVFLDMTTKSQTAEAKLTNGTASNLKAFAQQNKQ